MNALRPPQRPLAAARVHDTAGAAFAGAGLGICKRLRGLHACCESERNIVRAPLAVDGSFRFESAEHRAAAAATLVKAQCKICRSKYWATAGGGDKNLLVRA